MKKLLISMIVILLITSCTTVLKSTEDIANIVIADQQVTSGQVSQIIKSVELNSTEILIVDHSVNHYLAFSEKWKSKILTLDSTSPIFTEFLIDYDNLVKQYTSVEDVVENNWDKYSDNYKILLTNYKANANEINNSVNKLIAASRRYQAIIKAVELATILAGVAGK